MQGALNAAAIVSRWTARLGSIASIGLLSLFVFGDQSGSPSPGEMVALAFFPAGVCAGMVLGWWSEWWGGLATLGSLGAFYFWMIVRGGQLPTGPYFVLFSSPGLLFLVCALFNRLGRASHLQPA